MYAYIGTYILVHTYLWVCVYLCATAHYCCRLATSNNQQPTADSRQPRLLMLLLSAIFLLLLFFSQPAFVQEVETALRMHVCVCVCACSDSFTCSFTLKIRALAYCPHFLVQRLACTQPPHPHFSSTQPHRIEFVCFCNSTPLHTLTLALL